MNGWASLSRQAAALCLLVATGLAVMLMAINYQIRDLEREIADLEKRIAADRQETRVLKAEFNFLTEPERLRRVSESVLGLVPLKPGQVHTFTTFESLGRDEDPLAQFLREEADVHAVFGPGGQR